MTLSLFWSRYILELQEQHAREVDALYMYLIAQEKWDWFLAKVPETEQIKILRGHNHGEGSWSCRTWLLHMEDWIKANKPPAVYEAVMDRLKQIENKPVEELEKAALHNVSAEELERLQQAGYFKNARRDAEGG